NRACHCVRLFGLMMTYRLQQVKEKCQNRNVPCLLGNYCSLARSVQKQGAKGDRLCQRMAGHGPILVSSTFMEALIKRWPLGKNQTLATGLLCPSSGDS